MLKKDLIGMENIVNKKCYNYPVKNIFSSFIKVFPIKIVSQTDWKSVEVLFRTNSKDNWVTMSHPS